MPGGCDAECSGTDTDEAERWDDDELGERDRRDMFLSDWSGAGARQPRCPACTGRGSIRIYIIVTSDADCLPDASLSSALVEAPCSL